MKLVCHFFLLGNTAGCTDNPGVNFAGQSCEQFLSRSGSSVTCSWPVVNTHCCKSKAKYCGRFGGNQVVTARPTVNPWARPTVNPWARPTVNPWARPTSRPINPAGQNSGEFKGAILTTVMISLCYLFKIFFILNIYDILFA